MEFLKDLLLLNPFSFDHVKRKNIFFNSVLDCFDYHYNNSREFKKWCVNNKIYGSSDIKILEDLPYFPSNIFKYVDLKTSQNSYKTINSSGTTNQLKSKIMIDKKNSKLQTLVLSKILSEILGSKRKPFLIIDLNPTKHENSKKLSARYAGLSGYLIAASSREFMLTENMDQISLNLPKFYKILKEFIKKKQPVIIIGYTYLIYEKLISFFQTKKEKIKLPDGSALIHFGGWKKIKEKKIMKKDLNKLIYETLNIQIDKIIDIYGFTEQLGTVYPSFGNNGCRVPSFSELIVRDTKTLKPVKDGEIGFLQFISPIQTSYPGLSIINDDLGRVVLRSNEVVEFEVIGRPESAVPRGCGDTLPEKFLFGKN